MQIWDLTSLARDRNQDDLYDLFDITFKYQGNFPLEEYVVEKDEEMRIDLISFKLYGNVDQVGFLLNLNEISNPLNIKENDIIKWCSLDSIDALKESPTDKQLAPTISGTNKSTRKDPNREKFVENDFELPPNLLEKPQSSINIIGNTLVIGG